MALSSALLVLLGIGLAAYFYVKRCYSFWADHGIQFIEPHFPLGNLRMFGRCEHFSLRLAKAYTELKRNGMPFGGLYFMLRPIVLITDVKFVQKILIKDFHHFEDRGMFYNEKSDPLSANLLSLESTKWRSLRSKFTPTFTSGKMRFMLPTVVAVANQFVDCLSTMVKTDADIEIREWLGRYTTDVIGTCAFGIECNSLKDPNARFREMGRKAFEDPKLSPLERILMTIMPTIARTLGLRVNHEDVTAFFLKCVEETIEYRQKNNVQRNDFMDLLIKLKNDESQSESDRLTINQIAAQAFIFFLAGFETSSTALTFALYELAQPKYKHIQDKARREIDVVLAKHDGQLTYDALNEMTFIEQIVNESLRKYPPAGSLVRRVTEDYECAEAKMTFHKGLTLMIPVYGIHHDPNIFDEPEEFRPERFSAEAISQRPSGSFLAFGDGPRNCIGLRFGMIQSRVGLVMLLKHFQFSARERTPSYPMEFHPKKFVLSPLDGVVLNVVESFRF